MAWSLPQCLVAEEYQVATFSADITIPIGHACMGGGKPDAKEILDPLLARGFVLLGAGEPVVVAALDWCQCNNDSYEAWRQGLAEAAGTNPHRVMLATVHQHDAPICDLTAQRMLDQQGLPGANCDLSFHARAIERTAAELKKALEAPRRVTHFGTGQARVERVASNRRVVTPRGKITWERGSYSGDIYHAPEGEIDPWLKTVSLWDGEQPVLAWTTYAVHPMSHYGRGQVSADFPGLARARRQADDPAVFQIYFTGCSGDVTAGKYNDRSPDLRRVLSDRLYQGMTAAWKNTERKPLGRVQLRVAELQLPPRDEGNFTVSAMQAQLADPKLSRWQRVSAALGLSWRERVARGEGIDVPCLELAQEGPQFMILPAEAFVAYQLTAQKMRPTNFVAVAGFGDGAPGYIPTNQCLEDGYEDEYSWVAPGAERRMLTAMSVAMDAPLPSQAGIDVLRRTAPLDPEAALASIRMPNGFRAELVAAEPFVRDPIAMSFDEAGRAYVVELPEYNRSAVPGQPAVNGSVRLLEDTDGDGRFDRQSLFAEDLHYPTGIISWAGGVFVGAAPDLLYLKDTNGDRRADIRETVITGFGSDASGEGQLNSFAWTLDNRILISTGTDGGELRLAARPSDRPITARQRNVLLDPRQRTFELTSGGGQYGLALDDWGRTLVCANSEPAQLVMYDDRYLERNPAMTASAPLVNIVPQGKYARLDRISPVEGWREARTRLRVKGAFPGPTENGKVSGFFTSATGITVCRGDAWADSDRGSLVVGEPAGNLVYRAALRPQGLGLSATRADVSQEFVASTDNWFRPVQFANAPDGSLYLIDMYRELIEGIAFLPPQLLAELDPIAGNDRGRIYRLRPEGFQRRASEDLGRLSTPQLVELLAHANAWHRETAARLLYERQDAAAVEPLRQLGAASLPLARMQALHALQGLGALTTEDLLRALADDDARVRQHAVRLSEPAAKVEPRIQAALVGLAQDPDAWVRYQTAFSLGAMPPEVARPALRRLAISDSKDPWFRLAIESSLTQGGASLFAMLVKEPEFAKQPHGRELLLSIARQVARSKQEIEIRQLVQALEAIPAGQADAIVQRVVSALIETRNPKVVQAMHAANGICKELTDQMIRDARRLALDNSAPTVARIQAITLLACGNYLDEKSIFTQLLQPQQSIPIQQAALDALQQFDDPSVPDAIFAVWPSLTPRGRIAAAETLYSRAAWTLKFLSAIADGKIPRSEIDPARAAVLRKHGDARVAELANQVFDSSLPRRADIVAAYAPALELKGNADRGREVFRKTCAACHRLENVGSAVGADLQAVAARGRESLLLNILDPNREVKPQFLSYVIATEDGRSLTGLVTEETPIGLTLQRPEGTTVSIRRDQIDEMRSTGLSFMPEGLESQVDQQAMADLIAYLESVSRT